MDYSKPSSRRYPVKLVAKFDTMSGQGIAQEKIVNNDAEYNSFYSRYTKERNSFVAEIKTEEVIEQEAMERMHQQRIDNLSFRKLDIELKNAERVYKSYPLTQAIAWCAGILTIILGYFQLAQLFKW